MNKKLLSILAVPIAAGSAFGVTNFVAAQSQPSAQQPTVQSVSEQNAADTETDDDAALQSKANITEQQAIDAALANTPGSVGNVQLEDDDGVIVYSVDVGSKQIKVDAKTGKVTQVDDAANETADGSESGTEDAEVVGQ